MSLPRIFLLLAVLALNAGCASHSRARYTTLRVTNHRGEFIAEWVARGPVRRTEHGYRITAVERQSGAPHSQLVKYPDGWSTTVTGPHILRWRCGQPHWLYVLEND
jgi:hypothetical protein